MALKKSITQSDGVVTNYHRILFVQKTVNSHDSISVLSYVSKDFRDNEDTGVRPYKIAITYEKEYEENMTIEGAYEYLKTLPEFEGSEDI